MKTVVIYAVLIIAACTSAANAQKVKTSVDTTVDFKIFKTFGWSNGQVAKNQFISNLIISTIEKELTSRGLVKSSDKPDLSISIMAAMDIDLQGVGPTWNNTIFKTWGGYGNPAALMTVHTGTLVLDLIDQRSGISVLRGVASETLPHGPTADAVDDAKSVEKTVTKAIGKIFKKYPVAPVR